MERSISDSSSNNTSYNKLENLVPEILTILKNDKALSDMILDMINRKNINN